MGRVAWSALLLGAGALEWWGIAHPHREKTLSEFTRWTFQTDTATGRVCFVVALVVFAKHILKKAIS
jgi:hypothetical protein